MLTLLFRKMRNTKWMVICLLIGFVMASAMMSTIPIYMNASLQRMLIKDMETFQIQNNVYPGLYVCEKTLSGGTGAAQREYINAFDDVVSQNYNNLSIPALNDKTVVVDEYLYVSSIDISGGESASRVTVGAMTNIGEHINITEGRMYESGMKDGVIEVIATENALKISGLVLNTEYEIANIFGEMPPTKIIIVGMYEIASETDSFWTEGVDDAYVGTVFADFDTFVNEGLDTGAYSVSSIARRINMDYPNMDMTNLDAVNERIKAQQESYSKSSISFTIPAAYIFEEYAERASQLRLILWLLQIPVMLMIVFYLFMVSQLNVENEKNEISVFRSRGASRFQILSIYALESIILGALTAIIGPFVGLLFCQVLGASNGFLEFVNRTALPVRLSLTAFIYSAAAAVVFFVTTMVPIFPATKVSIVAHKQSKAKKRKKALWEKGFFDIILIAGSVTWLYFYNRTQQNLIADGVSDTQATINPFLFIASTAFILGVGLFIVRIYPLIVRLVYLAGKRIWSPAAYVSLNNIGRSSTGREKFIMVFLILTVALGIFFANTARALNQNAEDRISYALGADVVMTEEWYSSDDDAAASQGAPSLEDTGEDEEESTDPSELSYIEPAFERFEEIKGIKAATKVFTRDNAVVSGACISKPNNDREDNRGDWEQQAANRTTDTVTGVNLMTVIPGSFAEVCWCRNDLLPTHINNYLNALAEYPSGIILSSDYEEWGVELGDWVYVRWGKNEEIRATVIAFADYWPGINPYEQNDQGEYKSFAVMNYDYALLQTAVEPYAVWAAMEDDVTVEELYAAIENSDLELSGIEVASQSIISEKNDPMLQGMNGALTLGFITIMIMCIIGFLIYWILSIKSRTLQFGILRAMGMSYREIIAVIVYEQLLVSGVAIVAAVVVGGVASDLFVPLFQSLYSTIERVPPFTVMPLRSDYIKLYIVVGAMLLLGFIVLGRIISKIKISQALKLGED